jgi:hypothetical protein
VIRKRNQIKDGSKMKGKVLQKEQVPLPSSFASENCFIIGILLLKLDTELSAMLKSMEEELSLGVNFEKTPLA